jgi:hypothetical protein
MRRERPFVAQVLTQCCLYTGRASGPIASPREAERSGERPARAARRVRGDKASSTAPAFRAHTLSRRPSVGGLSRCAGEAIRPLPRPRNRTYKRGSGQR